MGIKDNFQQAVRELWKKDGQNDPSVGGGDGDTLKRYIEQNGGEQTAQGSNAATGDVPLETPYYRPPEQNNAQNNNANMFTGGEAQGSRDVQGNAAQAPQQGTQYASNQGGQDYRQSQGYQQSGQGYQQPEQGYQQSAQGYQQSAQGYQQSAQGYQQSAQGYQQSAQGYQQPRQDYRQNDNSGQSYYQNDRQSGYDRGDDFRGGYRQENPGNYNVNRSINGGNGGGYVPPEAGGYMQQSSGEADEITVISKNTSIDGNVRSLANMHIDGNIKGNVETTKNVEMSGKIVGDITCNNSTMNSAGMQGNISLKGRMIMDRDTILIGDLSSQYADINGRIRGKLDIVGKAELKRDAIVFGDINASTIAVTDGAIIQGYVNTTYLSKEDGRNVFPEAISLEDKSNNS